MSFSDAFLSWYNVVIDIILVLAIISFFKLSKEERANSHYWLPLLILVFTVAYETAGSFFLFYRELNAGINAFFGNTENPKYTVWVYNIFNAYILTFLYFFLIRLYETNRNRKIINGMMVFFLVVILVFNFLGIENIHDNQPTLFFIGASFLIIASGRYFIMIVSNDRYLDINPLRLFSFWQLTFILFNYSMVFLLMISRKYLWQNYYSLYGSLTYINSILGIITLLILLLTLAGPSLNWKYEIQPRVH
jgi:hypothetical protein